jgi:CHAD domain-containing protein
MRETLTKLGETGGSFYVITRDPDVPRTIAALERERTAVAGWPLADVNRATLATGIATAYARGRREFRASLADATVDGIHDWRKRVKDLWYDARLLEEAWPEQLGALADAAHELADLLGDDHDFAVLAEHREDLAVQCHRRRAALQDEAFAVGARLYAERPKAFARRIAAYLVR